MNNPLASPAGVRTPAPVLAVVNDTVTTTSLAVAEYFGKNHRDVLRAIENLISQLPAERLRNFAQASYEADYIDKNGDHQPCYRLTRDGFTLLAMGFTGKRALMFKLAYIAEFNRMDAELNGRAQAAPPLPTPPPPLTSPARFVVSVDANGKITTSPMPMPDMAPDGYALVEIALLRRIASGVTSLFYMHELGMGIVYDLERAASCDLYNHDQDLPALACAARGAK